MVASSIDSVYSLNVASLVVSIFALGWVVIFAGSYWSDKYGSSGGGDKYDHCMDGPAYWCATRGHYRRCVEDRANGHTVPSYDDYCKTPKPPIGSNKCTQGPTYWCASDANFAKCVQSQGYNGTRDSFPACELS